MTATPLLIAAALAAAPSGSPTGEPILIGLDLELGHATSTSATAIQQGARLAVEEINRKGGVLGGHRLELVERDNRASPARGVENLRELSGFPGLVAVVGGRFSPVLLEQVPVAEALGLPLLDAWASADEIVSGKPGSFVFRLSLRDAWAVPALLDHARALGVKRPGLLRTGAAWGRSGERAARAWLERQADLGLAGVESSDGGDASLVAGYQALRAAGADAILLVAEEPEGASLVRALAALPRAERLPLLSHWAITGGDFPAMCGPALREVDLVVVQTFSFVGNGSPLAAAVLDEARRTFGLAGPAAIRSPVGLAQAFDLVHILARAVDLAGSSDRRKVRDALERVRYDDGLVKRYGRPFTPTRHEALGPEDVFLARWDARGVLAPLPRR